MKRENESTLIRKKRNLYINFFNFFFKLFTIKMLSLQDKEILALHKYPFFTVLIF